MDHRYEKSEAEVRAAFCTVYTFVKMKKEMEDWHRFLWRNKLTEFLDCMYVMHVKIEIGSAIFSWCKDSLCVSFSSSFSCKFRLCFPH